MAIKDERKRFEAVSSLHSDHTTEARALARVALLDQSGLVRHEAAFVLGIIGCDKDVPCLLKSLSDPSPFVRHEAALALAQIGKSDCIPALTSLLSDPFLEVSVSAEIAIDRIEEFNR